MVETYAKLSSKLITSSLWATETAEAKVLWITLLAMKDRDGNVSGTVPGLARMAGISIEDTASAIERFQEPDPYSRTKEHEGRRLVVTNDGWHLLNHEKYRDSKSTQRVRAHRERKKQESSPAEKDETLPVTPETPRNVTCNHTDTDTDTLSHSLAPEVLKAWKRWKEHLQEKCKPLGEIEEQANLLELSRHPRAEQVPIIEFSILKGAVNLIMTGDHKPRNRGSSGGRGLSLEEAMP